MSDEPEVDGWMLAHYDAKLEASRVCWAQKRTVPWIFHEHSDVLPSACVATSRQKPSLASRLRGHGSCCGASSSLKGLVPVQELGEGLGIKV
ncbi:MAG: hypothetical protein ABIO06_05705 [Pseudolysinimonas sp.]